MNSSTMTVCLSPRMPSIAYFHDFAMSAALRATDCPLPLLLITGLMTHGNPMRSIARASSSWLDAYA